MWPAPGSERDSPRRGPHAEVTAPPKVRAAELAAGLREQSVPAVDRRSSMARRQPHVEVVSRRYWSTRTIHLTWRTINLTDPCRLFPSSLCPAWEIRHMRRSRTIHLTLGVSTQQTSPSWGGFGCGGSHISSCSAPMGIRSVRSSAISFLSGVGAAAGNAAHLCAVVAKEIRSQDKHIAAGEPGRH